MGMSPLKPDASLKQRLWHLLDGLCADAGFCIPPADAYRIANMNKHTAVGFAKKVLIAEGMVPENESRWMDYLSQSFIDAFGSDAVSKSDFD